MFPAAWREQVRKVDCETPKKGEEIISLGSDAIQKKRKAGSSSSAPEKKKQKVPFEPTAATHMPMSAYVRKHYTNRAAYQLEIESIKKGFYPPNSVFVLRDVRPTNATPKMYGKAKRLSSFDASSLAIVARSHPPVGSGLLPQCCHGSGGLGTRSRPGAP